MVICICLRCVLVKRALEMISRQRVTRTEDLLPVLFMILNVRSTLYLCKKSQKPKERPTNVRIVMALEEISSHFMEFAVLLGMSLRGQASPATWFTSLLTLIVLSSNDSYM